MLMRRPAKRSLIDEDHTLSDKMGPQQRHQCSAFLGKKMLIYRAEHGEIEGPNPWRQSIGRRRYLESDIFQTLESGEAPRYRDPARVQFDPYDLGVGKELRHDHGRRSNPAPKIQKPLTGELLQAKIGE